MDLSKAEIVDEKKAPKYNRNRIDYQPLFKKVAALPKGKVLKIPVDNYGQTATIRKKLEEQFEHTKFDVYGRAFNDQYHACIKVKD